MQLTSPGKLLAIVLVIVGCFAFIIAAQFNSGQDTTPKKKAKRCGARNKWRKSQSGFSNS
jgi:hypothetical protein